jgi:hypothetical protein
VSWLYWNLRVYRYDPVFQKVVTGIFWDGVHSSKSDPTLRKEDLQ